LTAQTLLEELVSHVLSQPTHKVDKVFIGQAFTAVKLDSGEIGLALTPLTRSDSCIGATRLAGTLADQDTSELARLLTSGHSHLRAVGLAAVNAVLQRELRSRSDYLEGDFLKFLKVKPSDNIATIDYYTTKIEFLKGSHLSIFDDRFAGKRRDVPIFRLSETRKRLHEADVVIFPPTFLGKIDELRKSASNAREFAVVHPTTPPMPEPFFKRGVTLVASMMILSPDLVLKHVMEGAGTTLFKRFCRKIAFKNNER